MYSDRNLMKLDLICDMSITCWKWFYDFRRGNSNAMQSKLGLIDWLQIC